MICCFSQEAKPPVKRKIANLSFVSSNSYFSSPSTMIIDPAIDALILRPPALLACS